MAVDPWGVAMKPAKPTMFGIIEGKPVFGLPGYPLSAQTVLRVFVRALFRSLCRYSWAIRFLPRGY
ncbi:MAG: hypothetical protein MJ014_01845 [Methanocorpusculum sp.]|nr:hypothetical protein [Methanocorpusculum sp.]